MSPTSYQTAPSRDIALQVLLLLINIKNQVSIFSVYFFRKDVTIRFMKTKSNSKQLLDFYKYHTQEILPILKDMEEIRIDTLNKFNKKSFKLYCLPIIIIFCLLIISSHFKYNSSLTAGIHYTLYPTLIIPILIFPIIYFAERTKENTKFTKTLKIKVFPKLLNKLGNIKWIGQHNNINADTELLSSKLLKKSGLFIDFNMRSTDDEFKGSYKDVPFVISETKMWLANRNKKTRVNAFKGIILSFKCNKKIKNRTIISTKGDLTQKNQKFITCIIFFGALYEPFIQYLPIHLALTILFVLFIVIYLIISMIPVNAKEKLEKVNLEDPCFSKRFNVFSSDQIEARYLITTAFMERFYNLKTAFRNKKIKCSFFDDTIMIAIYTNKNIFEICNLFKPLEDPTYIKECRSMINAIYELIESLKLDEKTGL